MKLCCRDRIDHQRSLRTFRRGDSGHQRTSCTNDEISIVGDDELKSTVMVGAVITHIAGDQGCGVADGELIAQFEMSFELLSRR